MEHDHIAIGDCVSLPSAADEGMKPLINSGYTYWNRDDLLFIA